MDFIDIRLVANLLDVQDKRVCVFITAGPFTKLCAWGRRVEDMCYEIRRAEACVD
jgi:hypothetical protein